MNKNFIYVLRICLSVVILAALFGGGPGTAFSSVQAIAQVSTIVDEKVDPALAAKLRSVSSLTPLEVVIVFSDISAASRVRALSTRFIQMQTLPMAGAVLTVSQIRDLANWPEIYSITLNQQLLPTPCPPRITMCSPVATPRFVQVPSSITKRCVLSG